MLNRNRSLLHRTWIGMGTLLIAAAPAAAQVVVADAGDDLTIECTADGGATATLDGLGSTVNGASAALDPDTTFAWTATGIPFVDPTNPTPTATFPLGTTEVTDGTARIAGAPRHGRREVEPDREGRQGRRRRGAEGGAGRALRARSGFVRSSAAEP